MLHFSRKKGQSAKDEDKTAGPRSCGFAACRNIDLYPCITYKILIMSIKDYFLSLSLNRKLIGMMLFLSLILISVLTFLYSQSEKMLLKELENQTAELSKAIQVGVEEVTSRGSTDQMRLQTYLKKLNSKGVKEISIISNADEIIASTDPLRVGEGAEEKSGVS
jgi:hypothetical protein